MPSIIGNIELWKKNVDNIYPPLITYNVLIGSQLNPQSVKLYVVGNSYMLGDLTITGSLNATLEDIKIIEKSDNVDYKIIFVNSTGDNVPIYLNSNLLYNPSSNSITATHFLGNATSATLANQLQTTNTTTNLGYYLVFGGNYSTGANTIYVSANLNYNPSTNTLTGGTFVGNLSGNATTATSSTTASLATSLQTTNTSDNVGYYVVFGGNYATGANTIYASANLNYNPSTDTLTSANFNGNALTATTATNATNATNSTKLLLTMNNTGTFDYQVIWSNQSLYPNNSDCFITPNFTFRPDTCNLSSTNFTGAFNGNATTATTATNANNLSITNSTSNASFYLTFSNGNTTGIYTIYASANLSFNPSTSNLLIQGDNVPRLTIYDSTGANDAKYCMIENNVGTLQFKFATDNLGSFKYPFSLMRESASNFCDEANFQSNNLTINKKDNSAKIFDFDTVNEVLTVDGKLFVGDVGDYSIGQPSTFIKFHTGTSGYGVDNSSVFMGTGDIAQDGYAFGLYFASNTGTGSSLIQSGIRRFDDNVNYVNYNLLLQPHWGFVGIGNTNPTKGALHVDRSLTAASSATGAGYLTAGGVVSTWSGGAGAVSIYSARRIWAEDTIIASSDRRIKKNIVYINDHIALNKFRKLKPCHYEMKDVVIYENRRHWGLIGDEVQSIFPEAVSSTKNHIPNIYQLCNYKEGHLIFHKEIDIEEGIFNFRIINHLENNIEINGQKVSSLEIKLLFKPDDDVSFNENEKLFCYGYEVNDFQTVDYTAISSLSNGALQEIDRIQQTNINRIKILENENDTLENRVIELEYQLNLIKQHLNIE